MFDRPTAAVVQKPRAVLRQIAGCPDRVEEIEVPVDDRLRSREGVASRKPRRIGHLRDIVPVRGSGKRCRIQTIEQVRVDVGQSRAAADECRRCLRPAERVRPERGHAARRHGFIREPQPHDVIGRDCRRRVGDHRQTRQAWRAHLRADGRAHVHLEELVGHAREGVAKGPAHVADNGAPVRRADEDVERGGACRAVRNEHQLRALERLQVVGHAPREPHGADRRHGPEKIAADAEPAEIGLVRGRDPEFIGAGWDGLCGEDDG